MYPYTGHYTTHIKFRANKNKLHIIRLFTQIIEKGLSGPKKSNYPLGIYTIWSCKCNVSVLNTFSSMLDKNLEYRTSLVRVILKIQKYITYTNTMSEIQYKFSKLDIISLRLN